MVRVDDIDDHYERAKSFSAKTISTPTDYP
jgi:hypothetical protein